ncbi:hypothetical protein CspeluHIS016_0109380 [Cutaneotrichosporon spelunceum]|uniref:RING-type domain-containing protein n=1 Tax=Cutaneotrichosporon spelunceum TaxID=1672016 RepID=A0AAD3YA01_9TREE|nr:hypothetical protein CspeluHIS016_0109380 [Cutaneotrichosporon spelunceum]
MAIRRDGGEGSRPRHNPTRWKKKKARPIQEPYLVTAPPSSLHTPPPDNGRLILPSDYVRSPRPQLTSNASGVGRSYAANFVSPPTIMAMPTPPRPSPSPMPGPSRGYAANLLSPPAIMPGGRPNEPLRYGRTSSRGRLGSHPNVSQSSLTSPNPNPSEAERAEAPRARRRLRAVQESIRRRPRADTVSTVEEGRALGLARGASMRRFNVWDDIPTVETQAEEPPPPFPFPTASNLRAPPTFERLLPRRQQEEAVRLRRHQEDEEARRAGAAEAERRAATAAAVRQAQEEAVKSLQRAEEESRRAEAEATSEQQKEETEAKARRAEAAAAAMHRQQIEEALREATVAGPVSSLDLDAARHELAQRLGGRIGAREEIAAMAKEVLAKKARLPTTGQEENIQPTLPAQRLHDRPVPGDKPGAGYDLVPTAWPKSKTPVSQVAESQPKMTTPPRLASTSPRAFVTPTQPLFSSPAQSHRHQVHPSTEVLESPPHGQHPTADGLGLRGVDRQRQSRFAQSSLLAGPHEGYANECCPVAEAQHERLTVTPSASINRASNIGSPVFTPVLSDPPSVFSSSPSAPPKLDLNTRDRAWSSSNWGPRPPLPSRSSSGSVHSKSSRQLNGPRTLTSMGKKDKTPGLTNVPDLPPPSRPTSVYSTQILSGRQSRTASTDSNAPRSRSSSISGPRPMPRPRKSSSSYSQSNDVPPVPAIPAHHRTGSTTAVALKTSSVASGRDSLYDLPKHVLNPTDAAATSQQTKGVAASGETMEVIREFDPINSEGKQPTPDLSGLLESSSALLALLEEGADTSVKGAATTATRQSLAGELAQQHQIDPSIHERSEQDTSQDHALALVLQEGENQSTANDEALAEALQADLEADAGPDTRDRERERQPEEDWPALPFKVKESALPPMPNWPPLLPPPRNDHELAPRPVEATPVQEEPSLSAEHERAPPHNRDTQYMLASFPIPPGPSRTNLPTPPPPQLPPITPSRPLSQFPPARPESQFIPSDPPRLPVPSDTLVSPNQPATSTLSPYPQPTARTVPPPPPSSLKGRRPPPPPPLRQGQGSTPSTPNTTPLIQLDSGPDLQSDIRQQSPALVSSSSADDPRYGHETNGLASTLPRPVVRSRPRGRREPPPIPPRPWMRTVGEQRDNPPPPNPINTPAGSSSPNSPPIRLSAEYNHSPRNDSRRSSVAERDSSRSSVVDPGPGRSSVADRVDHEQNHLSVDLSSLRRGSSSSSTLAGLRLDAQGQLIEGERPTSSLAEGAVSSAPQPEGPDAASSDPNQADRRWAEVTDADLYASRIMGSANEYEGLNHIIDFLGPAKAPGATPAELAILAPARVVVDSRRVTASGKVKIKLSVLGVRVANCPVCLAQYRGDDAAVLFPCGHVSHDSCARRWLRESNDCMVCRRKLIDDCG